MNYSLDKFPTVLQEYILDFICENKNNIKSKYNIVMIELLIQKIINTTQKVNILINKLSHFYIGNLNFIYGNVYTRIENNNVIINILSFIIKIIKNCNFSKSVYKNWVFIKSNTLKLTCYFFNSEIIKNTNKLSFYQFIQLYHICSGTLIVNINNKEITIPLSTIELYFNHINK